MSKTIYVVRHGQTDWNLERRRQGRTDIELNETGINQAHVVKQTLASIPFDICFSSPLKRASKTATIIGYDENTDFLSWFLDNCKVEKYELN